MQIKLAVAVIVGKTVIFVNRMLGKRGTSLPGMIALKIEPDLIRKLRDQHTKVITVTGTNGKTTTSNLLAKIIQETGYTLTHNTAGANMVPGIATAFIEASNFYGKVNNEIAVIEIDEATMPKAIPSLHPDIVVITNFFRDQLDRYGELDKTIELTVDSIANLKDTKVILNADDPLVATIGERIDLPVIYYGVAQNQYSSKTTGQVIEGRYCPFCQSEYKYNYYQYGQLGDYHCPKCGYQRPEPNYQVMELDLGDSTSFKLGARGKKEDFKLSLQGFYNLYNALAAVAAAYEAGIDPKSIKAGLAQYSPNAGRMERFIISGCDTTLTLVKNPTGFNEVLKTVVYANGTKNLVIAINDLAADGRDVSWLWDVDFEILADEAIDNIICTGLRSEDMAVRIKYAGVSAEKIIIQKDLKEAILLGINKSGINKKLFILPTYTNLFSSLELIKNLGDKNKPLVAAGGN